MKTNAPAATTTPVQQDRAVVEAPLRRDDSIGGSTSTDCPGNWLESRPRPTIAGPGPSVPPRPPRRGFTMPASDAALWVDE